MSESRDWSSFPQAARSTLRDTQTRENIAIATSRIRMRRAAAVAELPDWEGLRARAGEIKDHTLLHLDRHLEELEAAVTARGGEVHWARDAGEACRVTAELAARAGAHEVIKVKSMTTDEIGLNEALDAAGIQAIETDLAELVIQLARDRPSHILVPAVHINRYEIRDLFRQTIGPPDLGAEPQELTAAARRFLRSRFLSASVAVAGVNFAVAETGTLCVVESEGNGRMCLTMPQTVIAVMGIEKVIPRLLDLAVFLQLLPRSATGERMNPYTTLLTGPRDARRALHLVLLDNGRTDTLADPGGREALRCIRCSACVNVCPVYSRAGGHAYGSVYQGPIGAIVAPQLAGGERYSSLPHASSLCGACADVCPVKIDIPRVLVHLRGVNVARRRQERQSPQDLAMRALAWAFSDRRRYETAQRLARAGQGPLVRGGRIRSAPGPLRAWTEGRDLAPLPRQTFRAWWREQARG